MPGAFSTLIAVDTAAVDTAAVDTAAVDTGAAKPLPENDSPDSQIKPDNTMRPPAAWVGRILGTECNISLPSAPA
jgi:hypothetical protein